MADALQASCAAPVFKRPRLEYSPCESDTLISFESVSSEERFSVDSGLQEDAYEMTSSNDCTTDSPPGGEDQLNCFLSSETNSIHTTDNNLEGIVYEPPPNGFISEESSSSMLGHEGFNGTLPPPAEDELDENDDQDSTISELSGLSDLSNFSGQDWKPNSGPISWVQRQMISGVDPRLILGELLPKGTCIPHNVNDGLLWRLIMNLLSEPKRTKLMHINTLDDAVNLLKTCKKVIVLTGAGVSVSCGIPDFRSRDGVYARLKKDYPALPDPQAMFDIQYFRRDPRPFFKFAKEIYPGQFEPSPSHKFIKVLEKQNKLLRNYSQNIDTLESAAGIQNVITCHGSFATATCTVCGHKVDSSFIKDDIFQQTIPYCPVCPSEEGERGIMKPDIVFFGEGLSDEFHEAMASDKDSCDLLIVIGSSLKVRPVAMIPSSIPTTIPQILINREPLDHLTFDIELLGDCDVIIGELCRRLELDWDIDERIPRFDLKEVTVQKNRYPVPDSEVNNNSSSRVAQRNVAPSLSQSEESNSCDCRGMSAIHLDDSQDGSNQEPSVSTTSSATEEQKPEVVNSRALWPSGSRDSLSNRIPDQRYLFFPPNRYVFPGAEVYEEKEPEPEDDCCSTPTDYSSDRDSPLLPPFESSADAQKLTEPPAEPSPESYRMNQPDPTTSYHQGSSSCQQDPSSEETKQSPNT